MNTQRKNSLLLLLCAFIWGTAFVAQSAGSGMDTSRTKGSRFIDLRNNLRHGIILICDSFLSAGIDIGTLKGLGRAYKAS